MAIKGAAPFPKANVFSVYNVMYSIFCLAWVVTISGRCRTLNNARACNKIHYLIARYILYNSLLLVPAVSWRLTAKILIYLIINITTYYLFSFRLWFWVTACSYTQYVNMSKINRKTITFCFTFAKVIIYFVSTKYFAKKNTK